MRARSGSVAACTSSAVYRGVMYLGQFQLDATTSTIDETFEAAVDAELLERGGVRVRVETSVSEQLEPGAVGIVHGDDRDTVVAVEVAGGDVLPVAGRSAHATCVLSSTLMNPARATTVLHVRPSVLGDRREVEAVAATQEVDLVVAQARRCRRVVRPLVGVERAAAPLVFGGCLADGEVQEVLHGCPFMFDFMFDRADGRAAVVDGPPERAPVARDSGDDERPLDDRDGVLGPRPRGGVVRARFSGE